MPNFSGPVNTANGFANLGTLLKTAGFTGGGRLSKLSIFNPDATRLVYIHLANSGTTAPGTGTDGWPIGVAAGGVATSFSSEIASGGIDLNTVWIYATAVFAIKVLAIGN